MVWFSQLFLGSSAAQATVVLSLTIVLGLALGLIAFRGIRLGVGGVLFSGLALAHFGLRVDHGVLEFVREFGLILFVFSIGMQVGPGFVDSLRRRGLKLNLLATMIVMLGVLTTVACFFIFDLPLPVAVGLFSGGVTNTPSLAAASQVFNELAATPAAATAAVGDAGLGYAVAYPFGIFGIILVMLIMRAAFRIDTAAELRKITEEARAGQSGLSSLTVEVSNPNVFGRRLEQIAGLQEPGLVISRIKEPIEPRDADTSSNDLANAQNVIHLPAPHCVLREGMLVHAVGDSAGLSRLQTLLGPISAVDLTTLPGPLEYRALLVTRNGAAGRRPADLGLTQENGVSITRIMRAEMEFSPNYGVNLRLGDRLVAVGDARSLDRAEAIVGNSAKALSHPQVLPIFMGIVLGVILGSIPVPIPGLPSSVKLGLAGGPLLVAILLSRVHSVAGIVWYLPTSANLILREVGISLFLACVGLIAGERFMAALVDGSGLFWMGIAACITFIPLIITALVAHMFLKVNYPTLCGLLSGSMTDPPALAFANQMLGSDAPASTYATVYPLTMILRILMGQLLVLGLYAF